jgi:hypothetical protein
MNHIIHKQKNIMQENVSFSDASTTPLLLLLLLLASEGEYLSSFSGEINSKSSYLFIITSEESECCLLDANWKRQYILFWLKYYIANNITLAFLASCNLQVSKQFFSLLLPPDRVTKHKLTKTFIGFLYIQRRIKIYFPR